MAIEMKGKFPLDIRTVMNKIETIFIVMNWIEL